MSISIQTNIQNVIDGLEKEKALSKKVIERTVGDMRTRGPGWVSKAVREEYNISPKDVKEAYHTEKAGSLSLGGAHVDDVALVYRGRVLTPTHFKMRPATRPPKPKLITAEIRKGQRKTLSSIAFLANSGREGSKQIPFQRTGKERLPIEAIKTLSVPQMIEDGNENVKPKVEQAINENLKKRFEHYCEQLLKK